MSQQLVNFAVSFKDTFELIFDSAYFDENRVASAGQLLKRSVKLIHRQYLDIMALYDFDLLHRVIITSFIQRGATEQTAKSQELLLLALEQSHKILDPS